MATINAIDKTYFVGDLTIAQAEKADVSANIDRFVVMYKEEFLRLLLGNDMYAEFVTGLAADEAKWVALNNKITDTTNKISPVANYVYFFYQRNAATFTTGSGEKIMTPEGSTSIGGAVKSKLAWNRMVALNKAIIDWIKNNGTYTFSYVEPTPIWFPEEARLFYRQQKGILTGTTVFF